jgi:hypothetical protein
MGQILNNILKNESGKPGNETKLKPEMDIEIFRKLFVRN